LVFSFSLDAHRTLHSFPTRRSSDLAARPSVTPLARNAQTWVHHEIQHVDHEVDDHEDQSDQAQIRRHDRDVGKLHRLDEEQAHADRKSTRLNSSHVKISYAVFCLKK